jgi:uncharacterized membrane protein
MPAKGKQEPKLGKIDFLIIILSVLGMAIMAYLTYLKFTSGKSSFCDIGEGLSCSAVNQSVYSTFLGIPVAILGFIYFAAVSGIIFNGVTGAYPLILIMTAASLVFSLYLSYAEVFLLKTVCVLCETSKVLMVLIGGLALGKARADKAKIGVNWLMGAVLVGVLGIGLSYFTQKGFTPTKNYDSFAQCLTERGWAEYGTFWCPNCGRQKLLFGDSFQYLEYVECDPRGDDPQTDRCLIRNIEKTPTWIRESENNATEFERQIGVQSLEKLSELSGCALEPAQ